MSLEIVIHCDRCSNTYAQQLYFPGVHITDVRESAYWHGWHRDIRKRDVCPACWEKRHPFKPNKQQLTVIQALAVGAKLCLMDETETYALDWTGAVPVGVATDLTGYTPRMNSALLRAGWIDISRLDKNSIWYEFVEDKRKDLYKLEKK